MDNRTETEMLRNLCDILIKEISHLRAYVRHKHDCYKLGIYDDEECTCGLDKDDPLNRLEDGENIH